MRSKLPVVAILLVLSAQPALPETPETETTPPLANHSVSKSAKNVRPMTSLRAGTRSKENQTETGSHRGSEVLVKKPLRTTGSDEAEVRVRTIPGINLGPPPAELADLEPSLKSKVKEDNARPTTTATEQEEDWPRFMLKSGSTLKSNPVEAKEQSKAKGEPKAIKRSTVFLKFTGL